jgi:hypothetical protein
MAFTQVTVTRDYDLATGDAPTGTVYFTPSDWLVNEVTVAPVAVAAPLNVAGQITIDLFANSDPATVPADSNYLVREVIVGQPTRSYRVVIPHDAGSSLDLSTLSVLS